MRRVALQHTSARGAGDFRSRRCRSSIPNRSGRGPRSIAGCPLHPLVRHPAKSRNVRCSGLPSLDTVVLNAAVLPVWTWATILVAAFTGSRVENTPLGRALSGPVCAMLITAIAANLGLVGAPGPYISFPQSLIVKLATPLLLMGADLRRMAVGSSTIIRAFAVAAAATTCGALLGSSVLITQLQQLPGAAGDGLKLAAALAAKSIGGGINYIAVCETLKVSPTSVAAGIAVDNVFALLYFPLVSWMGSTWNVANPQPTPPADQGDSAATPPAETKSSAALLLVAGTAAGVLAASAEAAAPSIALPLATGVTVFLATAFPHAAARLEQPGRQLGGSLLFIYFATAGVSGGSLRAAAAFAPLVPLCGIIYAVHLIGVLAGARVLKHGMPITLVSSNAAVGGPATAGALAVAQGWRSLVVPGILVGTLGNAVATFVGLGIHSAVRSFAL